MPVSRRDSELTRVWDAMDELDSVNDGAPVQAWGRKVVGPVTGRYSASLEEMVHVDTNPGNSSVFLPSVGVNDIRSQVTVYNDGQGSIIVYAPTGMTIQGSTSNGVAAGNNARTYVALNAKTWVIVGG